MSEPSTAQVLPVYVTVGGQPFLWTAEEGLDPAAALQITRYVWREARKLRHAAESQGLGLEDLVQEGLVAAVLAARRFDATLGSSYLNYAAWWVRQRLLNALRENHVHLAEKDRETLRKSGNLPSIARLDKPIGSDQTTTFADLLPSETRSAHEAAIAAALTQTLQAAMAELKPRHRDVLTKRFGLGCLVHTQVEIAAQWGVSRQRVYEIEHIALARLRRILDRSRP